MDKTIQDTLPKAHKNIRGREYYAQAAEEAKQRAKKPTKQYYRIGEISEMLGLPVYVIQYWVDISNEITPVVIGNGKQVRYTQEDVEIMRQLASSIGKGTKSIGEVSRMLDVPKHTIKYWEEVFPVFNPNKTSKGTRKFTQNDVAIALIIKELLYEKGMKTKAAIEWMDAYYRKSIPQNPFKCVNPENAIALLDEVKNMGMGAHVSARIDAVIGWLKGLSEPT